MNNENLGNAVVVAEISDNNASTMVVDEGITIVEADVTEDAICSAIVIETSNL